MKQEIIIRKDDYVTHTMYEYNEQLEVNFINTHFSTYEAWRKYLHIEVNGHDGFNLYLEMNPHDTEKLFLELAAQARRLK